MSEKCGGLESLALTTVNRAHDTTHTRTQHNNSNSSSSSNNSSKKDNSTGIQ